MQLNNMHSAPPLIAHCLWDITC